MRSKPSRALPVSHFDHRPQQTAWSLYFVSLWLRSGLAGPESFIVAFYLIFNYRIILNYKNEIK